MRSLVLFCSVLTLLTQTACAVRSLPVQALPSQPVQVQPVLRQPSAFQTSQLVGLPNLQSRLQTGLEGEEVELNGIYAAAQTRVQPQIQPGAVLMLRNGQQVQLLNGALQPIVALPGVPDRMQVRVRGLLRPVPAPFQTAASENLALQVAQVFRV